MNYIIYALLLFILLLPSCEFLSDLQAHQDANRIEKLTEEIRVFRTGLYKIQKALKKAGLALNNTMDLVEEFAIIHQIKFLSERKKNAVYNIAWRRDRIRELQARQ